ncbi:hypothetical protein AN191_16600 [Loktanella sp. 5RATIMAR09]|uniref:hypothetical protein n=1 Tax=Loktanella sp. 5RATIMAR09 TaxID=1225655 RepID=UPI0007072BE6|nr:hypothetical protein [Loktanella sp. 5RATIMAR09]KQI70685.1 hypothetical protein AN191_16600 [Loktanella sp. 5RATIMAR09]
MSWQEFFSTLVGDAEMNFGFVRGTGLGAVLLAIVIIVFLLSRKAGTPSLVELIKAAKPSQLKSVETTQRVPSPTDESNEEVKERAPAE